MKKTICTLILLTVTLKAFPCRLPSDFSLTMFNNSLFTVHFDHRPFPGPSSRFHLKDISPGKHLVEVIKYKKARVGHGMVPVVVSSSIVIIPANSRVSAFMNHRHQIRIKNIEPNCEMKYPTCGAFPVEEPHHTLNKSEFQHLLISLTRASFESNRISIAEQAISIHYLYAWQVEEILKVMWFESSRIQLAKKAYSKTIDKENYFLVNNAFSFSSSMDELSHYISCN